MDGSLIVHSYCPQCGQLIDQLNRRLIVEVCGHKKCRECFIKEANGCDECNLNAKINTAAATEAQQQPNAAVGNDLDEINDESNEFDVVKQQEENDDKEANTAEETPQQNETHKNSIKNRVSKTDRRKGKRSNLIFPSHLTVKTLDGKRIFHCSVCTKDFKSVSNRKYHFYCDQTMTKPWNCLQCNKTFITKSHLNYHVKTHADSPSHPCKICMKKFLRLSSLRKHIVKKHDCKFKFICDLCGQQFLYRDELRLHENKHNNILPFQCNKCNKNFASKSSYNQHSQVHAGVRYTCEKCNKSFTHSSSLKMHRLIHGNVRQFECKNCDKTFLNQKSMERHSKTHLGAKLYKCSVCNTTSSRRDNIQRHVRNLHSAQNGNDIITVILSEENDVPLNADETIEETKISKENQSLKTDEQMPNVCSVIKYTGRAAVNDNFQTNQIDGDKLNKKKTIINHCSEPSVNNHTELIVDTSTPTVEKGNMKIYRQLLSPYLKPPPEVLNQTKFMDDNSSNVADSEFLNIKPLKHIMIKPLKKGYDHLEIYRRILLPDHDSQQQQQQQQQQEQQQHPEHNGPQQLNDQLVEYGATNETDIINRVNEINNNPTIITTATAGQMNSDHFTEMHWRKRTSQSFNRMAF